MGVAHTQKKMLWNIPFVIPRKRSDRGNPAIAKCAYGANITFCESKKYHLPKANITLALREYHKKKSTEKVLFLLLLIKLTS